MWELAPTVRLRGAPRLDQNEARRIEQDFVRFQSGLPRPLESYVAETYGIDLTSEYGGVPVKNPFGKASGQLSLARHQVQQDASAGLGFVVLKTVIAQDSGGSQSMSAWAIPETRMLVEPIRGRSGEDGWTVTWKGRGWYSTFDAYCTFFGEALSEARSANMLAVPSVKYHLPGTEESAWKFDEYNFTTIRLLEIWDAHRPGQPMPLEKDFSPTLAGSEKAAQQAKILEWLQTVPSLIHRAAPNRILVGLKLFNALFEDDFQLRMLDTVHGASQGDLRSDFLIYGNRLFDPNKTFEGKQGVAYGGPDLSGRNLAVLENFLADRNSLKDSSAAEVLLPVSATGDIHSGRIATEYLVRGASSFQAHTIFQRAANAFAMKVGNKTEMALHHLLFHPEEGLIVWILDLRRRFGWNSSMNIQKMAEWCRTNWNNLATELNPKMSS
jgi:hypothetical protein